MIVTNSDIHFAELKAFQRQFPSGLERYIKTPMHKPKWARDLVKERIHTLHDAINERWFIYSGKREQDRKLRHAKLKWSNSMYLIHSRLKDPKTFGSWLDLARIGVDVEVIQQTVGAWDHAIIARRIFRRMTHGARKRNTRAEYWARMFR